MSYRPLLGGFYFAGLAFRRQYGVKYGQVNIYSMKGKSSKHCLRRELVRGGSQSGIFVNSAPENSGDKPDLGAGLRRGK